MNPSVGTIQTQLNKDSDRKYSVIYQIIPQNLINKTLNKPIKGDIMTVRTWRCKICGDPYVGEGKPTHCPFCGAEDKYIIPAEEYEEPVVDNVSETSRNNIFEAIKLEVNNSEFYFCASNKAKDIELQARFKALGKVEAEHASLLCKIIKAQKPTINRNTTACPTDDKEMVQEAHDREARAIEHYKNFLEQAEEPRVKQVFAALVEIENTHLELAEKGSSLNG
jgi:rubrerythrin